MSYASLTYHIVFSTYLREKVIDPDHERELYSIINRIATAHDVVIRKIGGMPDHVHILCDLKSNITLTEVVKVIKSESSKFMRINPNFRFWRGWSEGYGAFTVSPSARTNVSNYIMNQRVHHLGKSFDDEYEFMVSSSEG